MSRWAGWGAVLAVVTVAGAAETPPAAWLAQRQAGLVVAAPAAGSPWPEPAALEGTGALEVGWAHQVLLAAPRPAGELRARLTAGVPAPCDAWLRRFDNGGRLETPELEALFADAVRQLAKPAADAKAQARVGEAACWIVGGELDQMIRLSDAAHQGTALVQRIDDLGVGPGRAPRPLRVFAPLPTADHPGMPLFRIYGGPDYDPFAEQLAQEHATAAPAEYRQAQFAKARGDLLFADDAALDKPVTLPAAVGTAGDVTAAVAQAAGVKVTVDPALATAPVAAVLSGQPARDALLALARAAGGVLAKAAEGYRLRPPAGIAEQVSLNAPLAWWQGAGETRAEAMASEQALVKAVWPALEPAMPAIVAGQGKLASLPAPARVAVARLVDQGVARRFRRVLASLPQADGTTDVRMFHDALRARIELSTPAASEVLAGQLAGVLLLELSGQAWLPVGKFQPVPRGGGQ